MRIALERLRPGANKPDFFIRQKRVELTSDTPNTYKFTRASADRRAPAALIAALSRVSSVVRSVSDAACTRQQPLATRRFAAIKNGVRSVDESDELRGSL